MATKKKLTKVSKKTTKKKLTKTAKRHNQEIKELVQTPQENEDYEKYRWFYTSERKLVIGGKNAEQNESIVKELIESKKDYVVMHTKSPGSPFAIIKSENPSAKDLEETAIFTASFSRAWKLGAKKAVIDIFKSKQIYKKEEMKTGTFGVSQPIERQVVELKLYLTTQRGKLRAVPYTKKDSITIIPGKVPKERFAEQISVKMEVPYEEALNALPTGNFDFHSSK